MPTKRLRKLWPIVVMLSIWHSRRVGDYHLAAVPMLPPAGILPPLPPCSRTILATLPLPSKTSLRALISSDGLPRRLRTGGLLTPARRLRRLRPTIVMLNIWHTRGRGIIIWLRCPAASSWDTAPAAPVQRTDPLFPAPIQRGRPLGPDQQRKDAKAAENQKAVDARKVIEETKDYCRQAQYLAIKVGRGSSSDCCAHAAS